MMDEMIIKKLAAGMLVLKLPATTESISVLVNHALTKEEKAVYTQYVKAASQEELDGLAEKINEYVKASTL
jgi:hypothetical protein